MNGLIGSILYVEIQITLNTLHETDSSRRRETETEIIAFCSKQI